MATRKSTRPTKRKSRTATAVATPAERMYSILKLYREHAAALPANALVNDKTPQEALKACRELVGSLLFNAAIGGEMEQGRKYVYLTLFHAIQSIEAQLVDLFDCAQQVARYPRPGVGMQS